MPNKDKKNKTSFKKGDKAAEKWTLSEAKMVFTELIDIVVKDEDFLSFQDVTLYNDKIPYSTFYYLLNKFPILDSFKKQLNDIIISRVNKGALKGDYVSTPAIWRMKQLGEKDQQFQDLTSNGKEINKTEIVVHSDKAKENLQKLINGNDLCFREKFRCLCF